MKKLAPVLVALLISVPSVSFAAALTTQQANSLIAVVQSSPGTPASAFTNLITAFSNITIAQADSLIGVVQAAPGVAANAFVNLLVSFTQDTPSDSAPYSSSQVAESTNNCNGVSYPTCQNGLTFTCTASGPSCVTASGQPPQAPETQQQQSSYTAPVVTTPQPVEQVWMNKFLTDAQNAINSVESNANSIISSVSNAGDCSNAATFGGRVAATCTYMYQGVTAIENLETWASSVQNPYRSPSCDYKLYYPLEQILQADQSMVSDLIGLANAPMGGGAGGIGNSRANQIIDSTNAQVSALSAQAQQVVSTCQ